MNVVELMARARDVTSTRLSPDDVLLTGRTVVVTGGGGGIGLGIALGAARFGADVAVIDIDEQRCAAAVAALDQHGHRALAVHCDVRDTGALRSAVQQVGDEFGRLDVLVNNAGGTRGGAFLTQPEASMRNHIDINLMSMLVASQEAARAMVRFGNGGSIVNVASIEGMRAAPRYAVYAACKAGMVNFTRTAAVELAEHGIRVNCIAPDHTISPGTKGNGTGPVTPDTWPDTDDSWGLLIPAGREGLVDECAGVAVWLSSPMAGYVTGVTVNVDGGTWASSGWLRDGDGGWTLNPNGTETLL
ncbi:SDR family NAD(P)-dependent oxidoreductase [uncultured Jatrophihabitans sp.]|uniref:SDR family NAD(P)-dependent oxidoreductase n=1 Tax=uncultured Jatrophihabitans sp. TaxID=1610747 RepID=UPI0035CC6235